MEVDEIAKEMGMDNPIDCLVAGVYQIGYLDGALDGLRGRHKGMSVDDLSQRGLERGKDFVKKLSSFVRILSRR